LNNLVYLDDEEFKAINAYRNDDMKTITKCINGGYNGLEDRESILRRAKSIVS
jgi:predicted chitinase